MTLVTLLIIIIIFGVLIPMIVPTDQRTRKVISVLILIALAVMLFGWLPTGGRL